MSLHEKRIVSTKDTPEIVLDPAGIIKISGRSIANCSPQNLEIIGEWIDSYACNPAEITQVDIKLEYLNKANLKAYSSLLNRLNDLRLKNKKFIVNWHYEEGDEDIRETGEFFSSSLEIPFNFILLKEPSEIDFDSPGRNLL